MSYKRFLYETHMHTAESSFCSITRARDHVRTYKERGYAGIIVTDHFRTRNFQRCLLKNGKPLITWEEKVEFFLRGYKNAKKAGDEIGLDVFLGWEFFTEGSEFLTYGLDENFLLSHKDLDRMPIKEYSELVRKAGGYLAQAHPYREKDGRSIPVNPKLIDGVEIYNAGRTHKGKENAKAIVFAREYNLPVQAGTDAHLPKLPFYSGIKMEKRAESIFDIIRAIKAREVEPILQPKEEALWYGNINVVKREAEATEVSEYLVKVFYDCKHAETIAKELCDYINEHTQFDSILAHMDESGKIEKTGKVTKTIIIGHHSGTDKIRDRMKTLQYQQYGISYGFDEDKCVITASKPKLNKSKGDKSRFFDAFSQCFAEDPSKLYLREAQFKYAVFEFMQNGLYRFLNLN